MSPTPPPEAAVFGARCCCGTDSWSHLYTSVRLPNAQRVDTHIDKQHQQALLLALVTPLPFLCTVALELRLGIIMADIKSFSNAEVLAWLDTQGLGPLKEKFQDAEVTGMQAPGWGRLSFRLLPRLMGRQGETGWKGVLRPTQAGQPERHRAWG